MALAVLGTGPSVSTPGGRKPAPYVEAREREWIDIVESTTPLQVE